MALRQVSFAKEAFRDLERIVAYISQDNPDAALKLGEELVERAHTLTSFHQLGTPIKGRPGARQLLPGAYYIVYRVRPADGLARVLRFWPSARDARRLKL